MVSKSGSFGVVQLASTIALMITTLNGCGLVPDGSAAPLATAEQVDIAKYMGKWYEIAKYPVVFETGCYGVTAEYSLKEDGTVRVFNTCRTADGTIANTIEGFASVADPTTNAKLTVYFFYPFGAPYWILELGDNYQYAVVGDPSRTFLWILSRTPTMDPQLYADIVGRLPEKGYDPSRLEIMQQFPDAAP
jgi:apolipoprotein D and lipocalin family protein